MNALTNQDLIKLIRNVRDFPKPGIVFRDITPLLADARGFSSSIEAMSNPFVKKDVDLIVGVESRGFIFGSVIAQQLQCGFVPVRKANKLPFDTISQEYQLEYGTDMLEIHADAVKPNQRILIVDDLLATGGTIKACCDLSRQLQGRIVGLSFLIELSFLNGRAKLESYDVHSVIKYHQE